MTVQILLLRREMNLSFNKRKGFFNLGRLKSEGNDYAFQLMRIDPPHKAGKS